VVFIKLKLNNMTYKELIDIWLEYKEDYVKESTYSAYLNIIRNHLEPDFGNFYLSDLNHNLLQDYIITKLKKGKIGTEEGLSEKTVKDIMVVLKSTLKYAMNQELMPLINLEFNYPKTQIKKKLYIFTKSQQKKITDYLIENLDSKNIGILLSLYTGMRIGELCALKWSDIDLRNNTVHVNKTLQRIYTKNKNGKTEAKIITSSPKTLSSNRDIPLNKELVDLIKPFKTNSKHYVLTGSLECTEPRRYRKYFYTVLKKLDLKLNTITFHSLRHTFASNCINLGVDYKTVSELLGHSDINITLNLYVHPNLSQKKRCINLVWKNYQSKK